MTDKLRMLSLLVVSCLCLDSVSHAQRESSAFSGRWEGEGVIDYWYTTDDPNRSQEENDWEPMRFRLRISREGEVELSVPRARGGWRPLSLPFALIESGDGAFIAGQHRTIEWVESQVYNVAKVDDDTLIFFWWRVVNNIDSEPDHDMSKWALGGHGEIRRR